VVIPARVPNLIAGAAADPVGGGWLEKRRPADGELLCHVARSGGEDVAAAVLAARAAQPAWAERTPVERGDLVREIALRLRERRRELSEVVAAEGGKSLANALGETDGAIEMGLFVAGEGRRSYGRTTTASMPHRTVMTMRQPVGVAALLISFNAPLPNVAWKVFPAIFCGNAAVLKPSEHTPVSAYLFAEIAQACGLPPGVLNVVNGLGGEAGAALVASPEVDLVSFTGSSATGRLIQEAAGRRLAKISMELGGKNALVVCDDADLDGALRWALASAFSNAGQRCASAGRIVVFDAVYEEFRDRLVETANELPLGVADSDFLGPVISEQALERILERLERAGRQGARILCGGERLTDEAHAHGWYLAPTVIEGVEPGDELSCAEVFGPVTILYRARDFEHALAIANDSPYGLTAAIHTRSLHRAMRFAEKVEAGVVVVNGGTFGSEPHMGFGGVKQSGTGWREAGVEALDVFSELKYVNLIADPTQV
jgi:acyl-CoA reductase-like NAD-dependent aldehyde dehydrogenase